LALSVDQQRTRIDHSHPDLSVRRQCELLGLTRSNVYYRPAEMPAEDLRLMRLLDEQNTAQPSYGSRRMTAWLVRQGVDENRLSAHIHPEHRASQVVAGRIGLHASDRIDDDGEVVWTSSP